MSRMVRRGSGIECAALNSKSGWRCACHDRVAALLMAAASTPSCLRAAGCCMMVRIMGSLRSMLAVLNTQSPSDCPSKRVPATSLKRLSSSSSCVRSLHCRNACHTHTDPNSLDSTSCTLRSPTTSLHTTLSEFKIALAVSVCFVVIACASAASAFSAVSSLRTASVSPKCAATSAFSPGPCSSAERTSAIERVGARASSLSYTDGVSPSSSLRSAASSSSSACIFARCALAFSNPGSRRVWTHRTTSSLPPSTAPQNSRPASSSSSSFFTPSKLISHSRSSTFPVLTRESAALNPSGTKEASTRSCMSARWNSCQRRRDEQRLVYAVPPLAERNAAAPSLL
mmetsp:Transcript_63673/g.149824  ORF Transcript_63673/g.149824 Transcript_63673/m.149824 type:complete len:342 (-) Transcript_63673:26-1051(-)